MATYDTRIFGDENFNWIVIYPCPTLQANTSLIITLPISTFQNSYYSYNWTFDAIIIKSKLILEKFKIDIYCLPAALSVDFF